MSFFSFDRSSDSNFWNYGNPDKEGYSPTITGRLVELSDPPATKFNSNEIDRWDDGNPKRNIRMVLCDSAGNEFNWDFNPGGKARPSAAMSACAEAMRAAGRAAYGLEDMLGMTITVTTQEPPTGFKYGAGSPRPWSVQIVDANVGEHRGTKHVIDPVTEGGQKPAAPAPQQPQAPIPQQVQQSVQRAANAMGFQQPPQPPAAPAPVPAPAGPAPTPAPAANQVPIEVYDQDIPF